MLSDEDLLVRSERLRELQQPCQLCPRRCRVDRRRKLGFCQQPMMLHAAISCAHRGEEPVLTGSGGAGTVFLTGCTMRCGFCQNVQISHGTPQPRWSRSVEQLAQDFLALEAQGCHNIEWVSPTQHLPDLVAALRLARRQGLRLPVVANSNGYERLQVLALLEGIIDVYVPDAKYGQDELARRYSQTPDYVPVHRRALREMWRQVGSLQVDHTGLARRGLLIRHLVLPLHVANTEEVLRWIGQNIGPQVSISVLAQYYPAHLARHRQPPFEQLHRPLTRREYECALASLSAAGLEQGWVQERSSCRRFLPDFNAAEPFAEHSYA